MRDKQGHIAPCMHTGPVPLPENCMIVDTAPRPDPDWSVLYEMPTRAECRAALVRMFAGPWPGPNRVAIAEILADHWLRMRDAGDYPPFKGEDTQP